MNTTIAHPIACIHSSVLLGKIARDLKLYWRSSTLFVTTHTSSHAWTTWDMMCLLKALDLPFVSRKLAFLYLELACDVPVADADCPVQFFVTRCHSFNWTEQTCPLLRLKFFTAEELQVNLKSWLKWWNGKEDWLFSSKAHHHQYFFFKKPTQCRNFTPPSPPPYRNKA